MDNWDRLWTCLEVVLCALTVIIMGVVLVWLWNF